MKMREWIIWLSGAPAAFGHKDAAVRQERHAPGLRIIRSGVLGPYAPADAGR